MTALGRLAAMRWPWRKRRYVTTAYVVARDPERRLILLGGLGLGPAPLGRMVVDETEHHVTLDGYARAPLVDLQRSFAG